FNAMEDDTEGLSPAADPRTPSHGTTRPSDRRSHTVGSIVQAVKRFLPLAALPGSRCPRHKSPNKDSGSQQKRPKHSTPRLHEAPARRIQYEAAAPVL
ncbi:hypothetical protein L915_06905, partial [Phytophthora nicotianae]